ncbi:MAG: hypothetical protein AB4062_08635 [Crocosphaera sp.]
MLIVLWLGFIGLCLIVAIFGVLHYSFWLFLIEGLLLLVSIGGSWLQYGRQIIPGIILLGIPQYLLWKLSIYFDFFRQPKISWNITERDS